MKFLLTMNMPSAKGYPVHQMTVEHKARNLKEFWDALSDNEFIVCTLLYRFGVDEASKYWEERGQLLLNTSCIGKAQEYVDYQGERDERY